MYKFKITKVPLIQSNIQQQFIDLVPSIHNDDLFAEDVLCNVKKTLFS